MKRNCICSLLLTALPCFQALFGQELPKTQPNLLTVIREQVKVGMSAKHSKFEAGWPAAMEKANSPDYYLALVSMTGPTEVWYMLPNKSFTQMAASMKRDEKDPVLSAKVERLERGDAKYVNSVTTISAMARPDLTFGDFPDLAKTRFFEISIFRVQTGKNMQFEDIARAYISARKRSAPKAAFRSYQVISGMPTPTYLMVSSVEDYGAFDQAMKDDEATFKGATSEESASFQKWSEVVVSEESRRFRVDPVQSYVPKSTRDQDPEFWKKK